jgi:hypothetical protein
MCGTILCSISLVGEYIGNNFMIQTGKPQFVTKDIISKPKDL